VSEQVDAIVIGGGVIGLASAFALADNGRRVALFDDHVGRGSSYAAAGMLAPGAETTPEHACLAERSRRSLDMWPGFAKSLNSVARHEVAVHQVGSLFVGWSAGDRRELQRYLDVARQQGIDSTPVTRSADPGAFVGVATRVSEGHLIPGDSYVSPEDVLAALEEGVIAKGSLIVRQRVLACGHDSWGVSASTASGTWQARCGVVATGFQHSPLSILSSSPRQLRPVRGVTVRLQDNELMERPVVRAMIDGRPLYVIQRPGGSVIVGATSEESSHEVVEAEAVRTLLHDACQIVPHLDRARFVGARVGLRPATADHVPFFDELGETRWAWSSGHFRHGFLLAPLAALDAREFAGRVAP
jgi:glycine oxidase